MMVRSAGALAVQTSVTDGQMNEQSDGITIAYNRVLHEDRDDGVRWNPAGWRIMLRLPAGMEAKVAGPSRRGKDS